MKGLIYIILISTVLFSCKKTKELLDIPFSFSTKNEFILPKTADREYNVPDSLIKFQIPDITNTIPKEFEKKNADINKLKSLTIEKIELTIKQPTTQNFGFMKTLKIFIGTEGIGETLVATRENINLISPSPTVLSLTAENADVAPYLKGEKYYLRIETSIVKTYVEDIAVESQIHFKAVANPLN